MLVCDSKVGCKTCFSWNLLFNSLGCYCRRNAFSNTFDSPPQRIGISSIFFCSTFYNCLAIYWLPKWLCNSSMLDLNFLVICWGNPKPKIKTLAHTQRAQRAREKRKETLCNNNKHPYITEGIFRHACSCDIQFQYFINTSSARYKCGKFQTNENAMPPVSELRANIGTDEMDVVAVACLVDCV